MAVVGRIIGLSLLTSGLGAGIGFAFFARNADPSAVGFVSFLLACVGAVVGAVAGAAGEIVAAQRRKPDW